MKLNHLLLFTFLLCFSFFGSAQKSVFYSLQGDTVQGKLKRFNWLDPFEVKVEKNHEVVVWTSEEILGFKDEKGRKYEGRYIYDFDLGLVRPFLVVVVEDSPWGTLFGRYIPKPWSADESGKWHYYLDKGEEADALQTIDPFNYVDVLPEINPEWTELVEYGGLAFHDIPELFQNGRTYSKKFNLSTDKWLNRFEIPIFLNTSIVKLPSSLTRVVEEFGGIGYDFGAGWIWRNQKKKQGYSFGIHFAQINFSPIFNYNRIVKNGQSEVSEEITVIEHGRFNNVGAYFKFTKETRNTLLGCGLNYIFHTSYTGEVELLNEENKFAEFSNTNSVMGRSQNNLFDFLILIGGKYRTSSGINIKPFFQLNIPLIPTIRNGAIWVKDEFYRPYTGDVKVYSTRFGLVLEFGP